MLPGTSPWADRPQRRCCSSTDCRIRTVRISRRSTTRPACRGYRNPEVFASSPEPSTCRARSALDLTNSMLSMDGDQHKRYRSPGPTVVPPGERQSGGSDNWITETVDLLIDGFAHDGRAELNVDFCAAIPDAHHHRQLRRARRAGTRHPGRRSQPTRRRSSTYSSRSSPPAATEPQGRPDQHAGAGGTHRRGRRHGPISPIARSTPSCCCCSARDRAPHGSRWASR